MVEQKNPFGFDPEADVIREERTQWLDPIIIVSGGFDPVHKGHIKLFKAAADHGKVHVLLNSDEWLTRKKGSPFLPYDTREDVLSNMECIEKIHSVDDRDDTVVAGLLALRKQYPATPLLFANGGDRKEGNIPELSLCKELKIDAIWGLGGEKIDSSSQRLNRYATYNRIDSSFRTRKWGSYEVLAEGDEWRTKILKFRPGMSLSLQRHTYRDEQWIVLEGTGYYYLERSDGEYTQGHCCPGSWFFVPAGNWHWVKNTAEKDPLLILEVWKKPPLIEIAHFSEDDIERKEDESEIIIPE